MQHRRFGSVAFILAGEHLTSTAFVGLLLQPHAFVRQRRPWPLSGDRRLKVKSFFAPLTEDDSWTPQTDENGEAPCQLT